MAVEPGGGNCPLTEAGRTVVKHGVTLVGETNLPALGGCRRVGAATRATCSTSSKLDASTRRARCTLTVEDDIVAACLMTPGRRGQAQVNRPTGTSRMEACHPPSPT